MQPEGNEEPTPRGDGRLGAPGATPRSVTELVRLLSEGAQRYVDDVARSIGHHRSDVAAIGALVEAARQERQVTPTELAQMLSLSLAAVTALLDRLEAAGHIRRRPHPADRRKVVVELTTHARETSRAMFVPLSDAMIERLGGYSAAELQAVSRILADLVDVTRTTRPPR